MRNKNKIALILAATMLVGSSMAVFAADGANSDGTSFDHVDTDVIDVTLPTDETVATVFDYYVDPEGLIASAGTLLDGTAVTGNEDGVYFKNTVSGGDASVSGGDAYSSSSDKVTFEGKNSVDVDVTVKATVKATDADKDIKLVEDQDALDAATGPALLMTLVVGSDSQVITSAGTTANATIAGVMDNFEVKPSADQSKYEFAIKDDASEPWESTFVQLVGKTNQADVPDGEGAMTVPQIQLTWTVAKHGAATEKTASGNWSGSTLWLSKDGSAGFSTAGTVTVEVSDGGTSYVPLTTFTKASNGWISVTFANISNALGGSPKGIVFVRITDGADVYVFENK